MHLLYKIVLFVLVLLRCMSEMLAAPVNLAEAAASNAADDAKAVHDDDEQVRLKS